MITRTTRLFLLGMVNLIGFGGCSPIRQSAEAVRDAGEDRDAETERAPESGAGGAAGSDNEAPAGSGGSGGTGVAAGKPSLEPSVSCGAGESRCDGKKPQDCVDGEWASGSECPYVCTDGACAGSCVPNSKQCRGNLPQTCDESGEWMSGDACENVCVRGECAGRCTPGSLQCSDKTVQRCDDNGAWVDMQTCEFVCEDGACGGVCPPNATRCTDTVVPQTCDEHGRWTSGAACPNLCSEGRCTGQCPPGSEDCLLTVPRTCNPQGMWVNQAIEQNVCEAICTPGAKQCIGVREQTCNATGTRWNDEAIRPPICDACIRDDTRCDTSRRMKQICTAEGIWQDVGIAQMCGAQCDPGATACSGFVSPGVIAECTAAESGDDCWFGWTDPNVVSQRTCDATGNWVSSLCPLGCTIPAGQQGAGLPAYFCGTSDGTTRCVSSGTCPVP